nr:zinc finger, CCHC-type [Tanacetum cinerariifolium]
MAAAMKYMDLNFAKLEKFEDVDFRRWKKKMHFLLSSMSVVYVLTTHMSEDGELWDTLEAKYMAEDASSKKFFIIKESLRVQDSDKPKGKNVVGPLVVNMMEHNNSSRMMMLLGGLTLEQLCMCVKIDDGSRPMSRFAINSIIESKDVIFDEHRFSSVPRPCLMVQWYIKESLRRLFSNLSLSLENAKGNPEKEAINDEKHSIMGNNTWVLTDLPPAYRPLGYKWILKRKLKVDGTVE